MHDAANAVPTCAISCSCLSCPPPPTTLRWQAPISAHAAPAVRCAHAPLLPCCCPCARSKLSDTLNDIELAYNDLQGDLSALAKVRCRQALEAGRCCLGLPACLPGAQAPTQSPLPVRVHI